MDLKRPCRLLSWSTSEDMGNGWVGCLSPLVRRPFLWAAAVFRLESPCDRQFGGRPVTFESVGNINTLCFTE